MKHQSGRSMVEILGVLAIIGVLSVGGLAAYNYAMDKKVVNDLMYDMELATTEIWTSGTTGPGELGEKMDVSVLGENHPNIRVLKLQHMENGEIVLDEADGEITEEDVAAVENDKEPAFLIEIHDITVAQCVQLLRNQDKLNTPFLLEDSDGNVFDPENGDDPQDFCEHIFGKDDPVAFGLISNAYAKKGGFLSIFYPETPEEKWQRELEDCAKQPKNTDPYIVEGRLCGFPDDCDCYNPAKGYFRRVDGKCVKTSVSKSGTSMFSPCVGSEEDRKRAIEYIKTTKVKDLTGMELVFKGVWFGPNDYDNPNSLSGFHAEYVFANVPCIIKDADGSKVADYVSTKCSAFDATEHTIYANYQGCCPSGYVAQVGSATLDNKFTFMDGKFAECTSDFHCADKGEGKEYCDTLASEPRCVPCPDGTEWITTTEGAGRGFAGSAVSKGGYACHCPADKPVWDSAQQKCVPCPIGTERITTTKGTEEKRGWIDATSSNGYACYCPAENPVWDSDNKQCTVCPDGTEWISVEEGKGKGKGYYGFTYSNGHACHYCPAANPVWDSAQQKCVPSCPDGTEWMTIEEGKGEGRGYDMDTSSNGYACHCPTGKFWNKTMRQCTDCKEGQISDGMGNCCDPETREGCKCTMDLLRNGAAYHLAKGDVSTKDLINGLMPCPGAFIEACGKRTINGMVYNAEPSRSSGICPNQPRFSPCEVCACPLQKESDLGYCPCGENQVWNSEQWACLCEAGYVWNDNKTKCVRCSYPECFDKNEKGCRPVSDYEKNEDGYCVSCTTTDCKGNCDALSDGNNGCTTCANIYPDRPYWDGDSCEECPFANQIWDTDKSVCVCADGYGLSEDGTSCLKCTEYEYKNKDGYCVPCVSGCEGNCDALSDGNNGCTTCANVYREDRPYWDGDSCEKCPAKTPVWNGYSCVTCGENETWSPANGSCMYCEYGLVWDEAQGTCVMDDGCGGNGLFWTENGCMTCLEMNPDCGADIWTGNCAWNGGNCVSCGEICGWGNYNPEMVGIDGADGNYHMTVNCNCDGNSGWAE